MSLKIIDDSSADDRTFVIYYLPLLSVSMFARLSGFSEEQVGEWCVRGLLPVRFFDDVMAIDMLSIFPVAQAGDAK